MTCCKWVGDAEDEGIQVGLRDPEADLAVDPGGEVVLGHGLDGGLALGRVPGQIQGLSRHIDLMDLLPGPLEVRPPGADDGQARIAVARPLLLSQLQVRHQFIARVAGRDRTT